MAPSAGRSYTLGIDLGTSFVAAATAGAGRVELLPLGRRAPHVPADIGWVDGAIVVGEAVPTEGPRVVEGMTRRVGDPTPILMGGTTWSVEQLVAALLRPVLDEAVRPPRWRRS